MQLLVSCLVLLILSNCCAALYSGPTCPQPEQFIPLNAAFAFYSCSIVRVNLTVNVPSYSPPRRVISSKKNKCARTCFVNEGCFWYGVHDDGACDHCLAPDAFVMKYNFFTTGVGKRFMRPISNVTPFFFTDRCIWQENGRTVGTKYSTSPTLASATKITRIDFCKSTSGSVIFQLYYDGVLVDGPIIQSAIYTCTSAGIFVVADDDHITGVDTEATWAYGIFNVRLHTHLGITWSTNYNSGGTWMSTHGSNLRCFYGTLWENPYDEGISLRSVGVIYDECTSP